MFTTRGARCRDNVGASSGFAWPGDELIPRPSYAATRWQPVGAPPAIVWTCLLQSTGGCAEFPWRSGDFVFLGPHSPFWVEAIRPERWLVLASYTVAADFSVAAVLAVAGASCTWLGVRTRIGCYGPWKRPMSWLTRSVADYLAGWGVNQLRRRAERAQAERDQ